jgi:nicotinate-nucleotide adenylyltransferase
MERSTLEAMPRERVTLVEIPALAISSTECRERTRRGEPVWYLVPDGVVQYISKHRLYQHPTQDTQDTQDTQESTT